MEAHGRVPPVSLYLDRSGWSALERGASPAAASRLKALATAGKLVVLGGHELLNEFPESNPGWTRAARHLLELPGVHLFAGVGAHTIWAHEVAQVCRSLDGLPLEALELRPVPVAGWTLDQLAEYRAATAIARRLQAVAVAATKRGRRSHSVASIKDLRTRRKLTEFILQGDFRSLVREIPEADRPSIRLVMACFNATRRALTKRGFWPILGSGYSPGFRHVVAPHAPPEVIANEERSARFSEAWEKQQSTAPGCACAVSVLDRAHEEWTVGPGFKDKFAISDIRDAEQATYAPFVDVFTCDKRTHAALTRKGSLVANRVLRATDLERIANRCEERVASTRRIVGRE
ncbi:MAG: hypothetical protein CMN30_31270 [Sandaracinus sp.]|nr:hypothetical protein [Sandaracinus sp.]|tara:strand:- start:846 stop:1886 length:1041 start_codon:yes stop_codon:yes gene_type:complete